MTRTLTDLGNGQFELSATAKNFFGSIEEREIFSWQPPSTIIPHTYRYNQKVFGVKRKRSIDYNWNSMVANTIEKKKEKTLTLKPGVLGPMTYQLKLQLDLSKNVDSLEYDFISRGKMKNYTFSRVSEQTLEHEDLIIDNALHVTKDEERDGRETHIWFDANNHYVLSAIKQIKKNESHRMFIISSQLIPPLDNTPYASFDTVSD